MIGQSCEGRERLRLCWAHRNATRSACTAGDQTRRRALADARADLRAVEVAVEWLQRVDAACCAASGGTWVKRDRPPVDLVAPRRKCAAAEVSPDAHITRSSWKRPPCYDPLPITEEQQLRRSRRRWPGKQRDPWDVGSSGPSPAARG